MGNYAKLIINNLLDPKQKFGKEHKNINMSHKYNDIIHIRIKAND